MMACQEIDDVLKNSVLLRHREIVTETLVEYTRRGNYVRIYPAKNSSKYD
jgi:hypothetical protein